MRSFDFSSWQGILTTILGLAIFTLIGVGIRVVMMLTVQQRQQRMNRQINERLRTLIAAYKTLGGSFTGELSVDPTHLRDLRLRARDEESEAGGMSPSGSERTRRIRDTVEAALSDIILLGTEEHVRLAARAARDMAAGQAVRTDELVVSLRDYIRKALDLGPVPADVAIPLQGPTRQQGNAGKGGKGGGEGSGGGGGGGGGGMGAMGGGGMGMGMGLGLGHRSSDSD
ncbi:conserved hypothetical protein [uncultured Pleomorphomonas sp.]|uniref:Uncharacterized protein n=2 Tax=Pleomorphomonas TaxID=261933 RepID=A0A2G9WVF2_9HYPH|nr:hypothetical protein [Pleomorphomonas carboxyditropha]PIO98654.1 hypothetical protein CJ014_13150 [Pleomorphomonas carboxyditropha]SCM75810.1 conserved hypothetical protein [uncultured Pleomorphomonas sp.]